MRPLRLAHCLSSEWRIAELAASGATKREIAQHLFVTRKTVEYHLRDEYQKLDIRSRTELGAVLAQPQSPG